VSELVVLRHSGNLSPICLHDESFLERT